MREYQYGNTVRLECSFFDFTGEKTDPSLVKVLIYNERYEVILEGTGEKVGVGEYLFDYTTEEKQQRIYYEWYGEIDGKPSLRRGEFITKFV